MKRYIKDNTSGNIMVKFVKMDTNDIILQVPSTTFEIQNFFNSDYVNSVLKNTFGIEKFDKIGDIIIVIDQTFKLE